jgi:hypothetical protein
MILLVIFIFGCALGAWWGYKRGVSQLAADHQLGRCVRKITKCLTHELVYIEANKPPLSHSSYRKRDQFGYTLALLLGREGQSQQVINETWQSLFQLEKPFESNLFDEFVEVEILRPGKWANSERERYGIPA